MVMELDKVGVGVFLFLRNDLLYRWLRSSKRNAQQFSVERAFKVNDRHKLYAPALQTFTLNPKPCTLNPINPKLGGKLVSRATSQSKKRGMTGTPTMRGHLLQGAEELKVLLMEVILHHLKSLKS